MTEALELAAGALALLGSAGSAFAVGAVLLLSDARARIHAAALALVAGVLPVLAACAIAGGAAIGARTLLAALFLLATAPVGAHVLAHLDEARSGGEDRADETE